MLQDHQGPVSRYAMNENQKCMKEEFIQKEREEVNKDVKRRRLQERNVSNLQIECTFSRSVM